MLLLFDASVLVAAHVGRGTGASAVLLSTVLLGGLEGCTVDNAIDEMANHLQSHYSGGRLKLSPARTARAVQRLAEAPTFTIHPWVTAIETPAREPEGRLPDPSDRASLADLPPDP